MFFIDRAYITVPQRFSLLLYVHAVQVRIAHNQQTD